MDSDEGKKHNRRLKSIGCDAMPYKMTAEEYQAMQGEKKGRYGVTVPKPFAFDIREKVRPKTIRERKVEQMVEVKQQEEEAHCA